MKKKKKKENKRTSPKLDYISRSEKSFYTLLDDESLSKKERKRSRRKERRGKRRKKREVNKMKRKKQM